MLVFASVPQVIASSDLRYDESTLQIFNVKILVECEELLRVKLFSFLRME